MKQTTFFLLISFCLVLAFIVGCVASSSTGVFPSGKDTYTVIVTDKTGHSQLGELQKRAFQEANDFCKRKGKMLQPVAANAVPSGYGNTPSFELNFRALNPDDPEYRRPDMEPAPDVKIDVKGQ